MSNSRSRTGTRPLSLLAATALVASAVACSSYGEDYGHADAELPEGVGRVALEDPAAAPPKVEFGGLHLVPQPGWIEQASANEMRLAQYRLPHAAGDDADAELVIYHFGGGGGAAEANIERWCSQFEQPDGRDSAQAVQIEERSLASGAATLVSLSGTYVGETFPGSGEFQRDYHRTMRAAIVPSSEGPVYIKLLGPTRTMLAWEPSWSAFLAALEG